MLLDGWQIAFETGHHLLLTLVSVTIAVLVGVPLGMFLVREPFLAGPVVGVAGIIQTIPSLALLGLLVPLLGVGDKPAIVALFLYALLPIVRNSYVGLSNVDRATIEAARGMGMTEAQTLRHVSLPQALPIILAGVRTSVVWSVGVATLAALLGAGGLGTFIFRGIAMVDAAVICSGAIPASILAVTLDLLLAWLERRLVSLGLQPGPRR